MLDRVYIPQIPIVNAEEFEEKVYESLSLSRNFSESTKRRVAAIICGAEEAPEEDDEILDAITWYHATKIGSFHEN